MTIKQQKIVKIGALSLGGAILLAVIIILIVKQVRKSRDAKAIEGSGGIIKPTTNPSPLSSSGSSSNTLNGRTFSKTEIEKMQSYLFNMGAMAMNELIVSSIRDSGGIDGKIGNGFKNALNEAIRINIVTNLDDLYTQAMKH